MNNIIKKFTDACAVWKTGFAAIFFVVVVGSISFMAGLFFAWAFSALFGFKLGTDLIALFVFIVGPYYFGLGVPHLRGYLNSAKG